MMINYNYYIIVHFVDPIQIQNSAKHGMKLYTNVKVYNNNL